MLLSTAHDKLIYLIEQATAFKVDDQLCFGSIGVDEGVWSINFDMDGDIVIISESDLVTAKCSEEAFDVMVSGINYNITPIYSKRIIDGME